MSEPNYLDCHVVIKPIPGLPGYFVDNFGVVYSSCIRRWGDDGSLKPLKPSISKRTGYAKFTPRLNNVTKTVTIHSAVLRAFVGPKPDGMGVCHANGIRHDNRLSNLRWDTQKNNIAEKVKHGTQQTGESNPHAKLNIHQIKQMIEMRKSGKLYREIAAAFGISACGVNAILTGRAWSHLKLDLPGRVTTEERSRIAKIAAKNRRKRSHLGTGTRQSEVWVKP